MPSLADAALDQRERRALERVVEVVESELGDDLEAVWLYGSRARGERTGPESDIDLLVLTRAGSRHDRERLNERVHRAVKAEGVSSVLVSTRVHDLDWLEDRRAIEHFFIREVDRDKITLLGRDLVPDPLRLEDARRRARTGDGGLKPRSREMLDRAGGWLAEARTTLEGAPNSAVAAAYYAMFDAASAALSERDRYARTHAGTWTLFRELYVDSGRFDEALVSRAQEAQGRREDVHYGDPNASVHEAGARVRDAERFLEAVDRMLGSGPPR